jgi:hypothetical protein
MPAVGFTVKAWENEPSHKTPINAESLKALEQKLADYAFEVANIINGLKIAGERDCSGSPKYPKADAGDLWLVSVAGKIGGASGAIVRAGDLLLCAVDESAEGTQADVGSHWVIIPGTESLAAILAGSGVTTGEGAPAKGLALGALYVQQTAGKNVALWRGKGAGEEPEQVADLSGTPADGSVTAAKVAAANVDGAAGTPGMRSLDTAAIIGGESTDTQTPSRKAVEAALKLLAKVWRVRMTVATVLAKESAKETKFFVLPGASSQAAPAAATNQVWKIGWVAADEAVTGLATKCKIKTQINLAAKMSATVHIALYKVTEAGTLTLGEEVPGSGVDLVAGEEANKAIKGESGEFEIAEDGDYAIGATVSAVTAAACGVQARLNVHNV